MLATEGSDPATTSMQITRLIRPIYTDFSFLNDVFQKIFNVSFKSDYVQVKQIQRGKGFHKTHTQTHLRIHISFDNGLFEHTIGLFKPSPILAAI